MCSDKFKYTCLHSSTHRATHTDSLESTHTHTHTHNSTQAAVKANTLQATLDNQLLEIEELTAKLKRSERRNQSELANKEDALGEWVLERVSTLVIRMCRCMS